MIKFYKILARAICIWALCLIVSGIFFEQYVGLICTIGVVFILGSYLIFAICRVYKIVRKQPISGNSEIIKPENKIHVTAKMTGKTNRVSYMVRGQSRTEYTEYEIEYSVLGQKYIKWFHMYPGPDLGDVYEPGCEVQIICDKKNPSCFEVIRIGNQYERDQSLDYMN